MIDRADSRFKKIFNNVISKVNKSIPQYEDIDDTLRDLPQLQNDDELIECLAYCIIDRLSQTQDINKFTYNPMNIRFEVLVENQRGSNFLGIPVYSNHSLLQPFDPPKFQSLNGHGIESMIMYPLPNKNWKWVWDNWYALMLKNVDEEGWVYSKIKFTNGCWKAHGGVGVFVRRRIWIRMTERIEDNRPKSAEEVKTIYVSKRLNVEKTRR